MTKSPSIFRRAYRLKPSRGADDAHVSQLRIGGEKTSQIVPLPYSNGLGYFIVPTHGAVRSIEGDDFRASGSASRFRSGFAAAKPPVQEEEIPPVRGVLAVLVRRQAEAETLHRLQSAHVQHRCRARRPPGHDPSRASPRLDDGRARQASSAAGCRGGARGGSVVHVSPEDTWLDIAGVMSRLAIPFDLIVTTVPGRERFVEPVKRDFPDADVIVSENRGRDVRPFLELLETGRLDRYRYVCKIHGKKSNDGGRIAYLGALRPGDRCSTSWPAPASPRRSCARSRLTPASA